MAIHVRRTDYLKIPAFAVCGKSYYSAAMETIRARVHDPRFFIFSDDPGWCRREFASADTVVVSESPPSPNPLRDMYLMSLATHHIIANSTYSWWAAWIAKSDIQQVMMPDRWLAGETIVPISEKKLSHWTIIPTLPA
ncbi:MAG: alpha-1,2-fucosyltransferase [Akkermansiaceae bacterium]|nr:alpha-1,2-fucosyltransferase [Akkermansiaceae bacterium]MDP4721495.1 alpha-1,2-fucosyltransferase [Akkermansiaceae bacterium]